MRQNFWTRWSKEYVSELQKRTKWQTHKHTLIPDTLVLIKEDNVPPLQWRLGRVLQTFAGGDGISRVASIKTATGIIQRSFSKICPLFPQEDDPLMTHTPLWNQPGASKAGGMSTHLTPSVGSREN
ncbi:uncharacterized protein LOC125491085 [Plutella xylostella]|uniref:uncharacterized protein LOC125491085 n=1 Tax=Plutella xylostella TaxID=51655 RepID=UPI0018D13147|nr:uncharacterized protein LOC125491085 [Plutella xylostella]